MLDRMKQWYVSGISRVGVNLQWQRFTRRLGDHQPNPCLAGSSPSEHAKPAFKLSSLSAGQFFFFFGVQPEKWGRGGRRSSTAWLTCAPSDILIHDVQ